MRPILHVLIASPSLTINKPLVRDLSFDAHVRTGTALVMAITLCKAHSVHAATGRQRRQRALKPIVACDRKAAGDPLLVPLPTPSLLCCKVAEGRVDDAQLGRHAARETVAMYTVELKAVQTANLRRYRARDLAFIDRERPQVGEPAQFCWQGAGEAAVP